MAHPVLSVVLCTYDGAAYLQEQLESLLCQTRKPDEIVIGDDCSRDDTWPILEAFRKKAGAMGIRVELTRHERNMGYVRNFSETLQKASGDLLFLCDQDDIWYWDKMALVAERFAREPGLLLVCSDARLVDADGSPLPHTLFDALELRAAERRALREGRAFDTLLRRSMVTGATAAFRKELLDVALPVGRGWIHDEWLAIVAAAAGRIGVIEDALIDYRQHGRNQVGMRKRTLADKLRDIVRPRQRQFVAEVERLDALHGHLASAPGNFDHALGQVQRKREHFQRRVALGRLSHWARVPGIVREAARGEYRRYGTGGRSMLRDLFRRG